MTVTPLESRNIPSRLIAAAGWVHTSSGSFQPFADYTGPLDVSLAGDLNGNGYEEIVIGGGEGGGPRVTVIDSHTRQVITNFFAFEPSFRGGIAVAVDGERRQLLVAAGRGGAPVVASYSLDDWSETSRELFGPAEYRGGVSIDADSTPPVVAAEIRLGTGPLPIYLDLGDLQPFEAANVAVGVYRLLQPLSDLIHVTTTRPRGYPSEYITVVRDDLGYYPIPATGLAVATWGGRQPQSYTPTAVYVSDLLTLDDLPQIIAHEVGHVFGLAHSDEAGNVMHAPAGRGGFSSQQIQSVRSTILKGAA